jgi:hypothetical protein
MARRESRDASNVATLQAAYFVLTGLWPFVSRRLFESVTGPKADWWLVETVGSLVTVIGLGLGLSGWRSNVPAELAVVGAGSCAALAAIDVVHVAERRISPVYLLDAAVEVSILAGWLRSYRGRR